MATLKVRKPVLGPAFDAHQMNDADRIRSYTAELRYYRPRGFSKLARKGDSIAARLEAGDCEAIQAASEWTDDVEFMLTDWARKVCRHDFIYFGSTSDGFGDVGFGIAVESAMEE